MTELKQILKLCVAERVPTIEKVQSSIHSNTLKIRGPHQEAIKAEPHSK